ncbi:hypothetical protein CNMCM8927_008606 [Aspergillus lentulus]|uniref:Nitronate monooxygenase n=1 Tax=Aspergillus lentulus TaxID=293939 RepID=A0AAN5YL45_ASPLE|nr:hypothetical protein CNMCM8927_008606 [Aspergillus lentulus]
MSFHTALTKRLGIRTPVIQGGMQWVAYAELAAAVSNAGALGILSGLSQPTPAALRNEIRKCRSLTSKPFGVNLTMLPALNPPDYLAYTQAVVDEGVQIVETAGSNPASIIAPLKEANITIIHKCTSIRHARSAIKLGVDFLSIDGFECAGHIGENDVTNLILLSRARQELGIPFIASGGFADGYGLAAALILGAEGINMGTRFLCTKEAPVHHNVKQTIIGAQETDTILVLRRWRNTSRLYANKVAKDVLEIEGKSRRADFEQVAPLVSGQRSRQVFIDGDINSGVWTAGQAIGLIHDIPTCAKLLSRMNMEAVEAIKRVAASYNDSLQDWKT